MFLYEFWNMMFLFTICCYLQTQEHQYFNTLFQSQNNPLFRHWELTMCAYGSNINH